MITDVEGLDVLWLADDIERLSRSDGDKFVALAKVAQLRDLCNKILERGERGTGDARNN